MTAIIANYNNCSTSGLRSLDLQLIVQIERIAPGVLVRIDDIPRIQFGSGCHPYLQAPAAAALKKAIAARPGVTMVMNSAYRTLAQQLVLYAHCRHERCGIRAAAIPGRSNHNSGLGIDIEDAQGWRPYLEKFDWDWIGSFDPMHFDFKGQGCKNLGWLSTKAFQQLFNYNHPTCKIPEDGQ